MCPLMPTYKLPYFVPETKVNILYIKIKKSSKQNLETGKKCKETIHLKLKRLLITIKSKIPQVTLEG